MGLLLTTLQKSLTAPDSTGSRAGAHENGTFPSARRAGKSESPYAWDRGTSNGTIVDVNSGICLGAYNADHANGTKRVLWTCDGQGNQRWGQT